MVSRIVGIWKHCAKLVVARRILAGPFAGLKYLSSSHGSALMPKVLGTYELEITHIISRYTQCEGATIVDIGAAEGYYAVGFAYRNPTQFIIAFESDALARSAISCLAQLNNVADRVETRGHCTASALNECLSWNHPALIIVDVEGYEGELLDPTSVPLLKQQTLLVEVHEDFRPGVSSTLTNAFSTTHDIVVIPAAPRTSRDISALWFRLLAVCSRAAARTLLWERPPGMCWLFMTPRGVSEG